MRRTRLAFAALAAFTFALAPAIADARPGGGASSGSRGSRTYSAPPATSTAPGGAQQMNRTATEPGRPGTAGAPATAARPGAATPAAAGGSWFSRNPLAAGLMGGLLGAGLFGMLSGSGLFGGLGGLSSIFGLLLQLALIGGLVFLLVKVWRSRSAASAGAAPVSARGGMPRPALAGAAGLMGNRPDRGMARDLNEPARRGGAGGGARPSDAIALAPAEFEAFEQLLIDINTAWSQRDEAALRRLSTGEMAGYFVGDLADLKRRGWHNETSDVRLEQGDLSEAWQEAGRDYATVAMRFSLIDVTRQAADGVVVEGDPATRREATELWTFVRPAGGVWQVSAIQQT